MKTRNTIKAMVDLLKDEFEVEKVGVRYYRFDEEDGTLKHYSRKEKPFTPAPRGGACEVRAEVVIEGKALPFYGASFCLKIDQFNYKIGVAIALGRVIDQIRTVVSDELFIESWSAYPTTVAYDHDDDGIPPDFWYNLHVPQDKR